MTNENIIESAHSIAAAIETATARRSMPVDEILACAAMSCSLVLGRRIGPVGTVEYLRNVADLLERQLLDAHEIN